MRSISFSFGSEYAILLKNQKGVIALRIGCVKEIKNNEFRVGMTPDNVRAYTAAGHEVYIERGAGLGSGFADEEYALAGAAMLDDAAEVWRRAEMMVKAKQPKKKSKWQMRLEEAQKMQEAMRKQQGR